MNPDPDPASLVYRCPVCGFGFSTDGRMQPPAPRPVPILTCPVCLGPALLTDGGEAYTIDEFIKLREKVTVLLSRRKSEAAS